MRPYFLTFFAMRTVVTHNYYATLTYNYIL